MTLHLQNDELKKELKFKIILEMKLLKLKEYRTDENELTQETEFLREKKVEIGV